MEWKLKLNPETNAPIVTEEGKIVYIDPEGKELPLNPPAMYKKISELNKEAKGHREKKEALAARLELFKDIDGELSEWKKKADEALQTVANFDDKDWMKADKVDKLKKEITEAYEDKLKQVAKVYDEKEKAQMDNLVKKEDQIRRLLISNQFAVSKYFSGGGDKSVTILPSGIAEDHFGRYFKVEEDASGMPTTKAYYANGDLVLSKLNPGEPADFEEAIGLIIDNYPGKDSILRSMGGGSGGSGGGSGSAGSGESGDLKTLQTQYENALKNGQGQLAITLRNKIFALEQKIRKAG